MSITANQACENRIAALTSLKEPCVLGEKVCYNHDKLFKILIDKLPTPQYESFFKALIMVCRFWYMGTYSTIKKEIEAKQYQDALSKIFRMKETLGPAGVLIYNRSSCAFREVSSKRPCDAHYAIDIAASNCRSGLYPNGYIHGIKPEDFNIIDYNLGTNGCGIRIESPEFIMHIIHLRGRTPEFCSGARESVNECFTKDELYKNGILKVPMGDTGSSGGMHFHIQITYKANLSYYATAVDVAQLCFNMYFTLRMFDNYKDIMFKETYDVSGKDKVVIAELSKQYI